MFSSLAANTAPTFSPSTPPYSVFFSLLFPPTSQIHALDYPGGSVCFSATTLLQDHYSTAEQCAVPMNSGSDLLTALTFVMS